MQREIGIVASILVIFISGCILQPSISNDQTNNQTLADVKNLTDQNVTVTKESQAPKNTTPYKNDLYTLDKPVNWEIEENDVFTYFKSPQHENQTELQENIVIYIKPLEPEDQDLKNFFQNSIEILMSTSPSFKIINYSEYKLGDVPAYKILYSDSELKYLQIFAVKENDGYIITYIASAENFDRYLSEAEAIMESYRLT